MAKVDFDEYADTYEVMLKEQLAFFSGDRSYFSAYKIEILRDILGEVGSILDFGCGVGLSLPHFSRFFPTSKIFATDVSEKSLAHIAKMFDGVTILTDSEVDQHQYDLIFVSCVMHHVPPAARPELLRRLDRMLAPGGRLCVFEHNPYNPLTQRMVAICPFDQDAVLLSRRTLTRLIREVTGRKIVASGFSLFFPQVLSVLRPLENKLRWLPLGGQYYVIVS